MTEEKIEQFYCPNCGHLWKVPFREWSRLVKVKAKESPGRSTMPKCPKCQYEKTQVLLKRNTA